MHCKIELFFDKDDPVTVDNCTGIGAVCLHPDKHGYYDNWRCDWYCQTEKEIFETLQKIHKLLARDIAPDASK